MMSKVERKDRINVLMKIKKENVLNAFKAYKASKITKK
jgi:hypothetical protein